MYMKQFFLLFLLMPLLNHAQKFEVINSGKATNPRGIGIYGNTIWIGGSNGYTARSADKGKTWKWQQVKGFEKKDFRDIEVLNETTAILMVIESPAYILRTTDAGQTWQEVYKNSDTAMFLDALSFKNKGEGFVIGDPIENNEVFIAKTSDAGKTWQPYSRFHFPKLIKGEAFFAASGTNITVNGNNIYLVSGGLQSRLFTNSGAKKIPLMQGTPSCGANGIAVYENRLMIVGGDFAKPNRSDSVLIYSTDKGKTFRSPIQGPGGYRSAVAALDKNTWITCGLNGVDLSMDGGMNWRSISKESFNSVVVDRKSKTAWLTGSKGKIAKLTF